MNQAEEETSNKNDMKRVRASRTEKTQKESKWNVPALNLSSQHLGLWALSGNEMVLLLSLLVLFFFLMETFSCVTILKSISLNLWASFYFFFFFNFILFLVVEDTSGSLSCNSCGDSKEKRKQVVCVCVCVCERVCGVCVCACVCVSVCACGLRSWVVVSGHLAAVRNEINFLKQKQGSRCVALFAAAHNLLL